MPVKLALMVISVCKWYLGVAAKYALEPQLSKAHPIFEELKYMPQGNAEKPTGSLSGTDLPHPCLDLSASAVLSVALL
jgi:hypothetical protein